MEDTNYFDSDIDVQTLKLFASNVEFEAILHVGKSGLISLEDEYNELLIIHLSQEQLIELRNFLNEHVKDK